MAGVQITQEQLSAVSRATRIDASRECRSPAVSVREPKTNRVRNNFLKRGLLQRAFHPQRLGDSVLSQFRTLYFSRMRLTSSIGMASILPRELSTVVAFRIAL